MGLRVTLLSGNLILVRTSEWACCISAKVCCGHTDRHNNGEIKGESLKVGCCKHRSLQLNTDKVSENDMKTQSGKQDHSENVGLPVLKAKMYAISRDTHQLQLIKLHHFQLERFKSI